jgi:hypothetical protein
MGHHRCRFGTGILAVLTLFLVHSTMRTNRETVKAQQQQMLVNAATLTEMKVSAEARDIEARYMTWLALAKTSTGVSFEWSAIPAANHPFVARALAEGGLARHSQLGFLTWT